MVEQGGETVQFNPPSRQTVAHWVVSSLQTLPPEVIKRSWRHDPFSYFLAEHENSENQQEQQANSNALTTNITHEPSSS